MPFYPRKLKHDFLIDGGLEVTGNTTLTGTLAQVGVATFTASPVFSAGVTLAAQKSGITFSTGGYFTEHVESLTGSVCYTTKRAGTALLGYGVSNVALTVSQASDAVDFAVKVAGPVAAGVHKYINISRATGASTYECHVLTAASSQVFYGSTANCIQFTTDAMLGGSPASVHLLGVTTKQWAVVGAWAGPSSSVVLIPLKLANT
jgi:hypothetical protein